MTLLIALIIILVIKCIFNPRIYKVEDGIILFYTPLFNKFIRKYIKINL